MIHSIVSDEMLYAGLDQITAPVEMQINGVCIQMEWISNNQARVCRLLSPNPNDYMNEKYAPGQIITFQSLL